MASFTRVFFNNDESGSVMWRHITDYLRDGAKSVEVLSRVVDGKPKWELRVWDGVRADGSNGSTASPNKEY